MYKQLITIRLVVQLQVQHPSTIDQSIPEKVEFRMNCFDIGYCTSTTTVLCSDSEHLYPLKCNYAICLQNDSVCMSQIWGRNEISRFIFIA